MSMTQNSSDCEGYVGIEAVTDAFPDATVVDVFKAPHIISSITGHMMWRLEDVAATIEAGAA